MMRESTLALEILKRCPNMRAITVTSYGGELWATWQRPDSTGFHVYFTVEEALCLISGSSPSNI